MSANRRKNFYRAADYMESQQSGRLVPCRTSLPLFAASTSIPSRPDSFSCPQTAFCLYVGGSSLYVCLFPDTEHAAQNTAEYLWALNHNNFHFAMLPSSTLDTSTTNQYQGRCCQNQHQFRRENRSGQHPRAKCRTSDAGTASPASFHKKTPSFMLIVTADFPPKFPPCVLSSYAGRRNW